MSVESEIRTAEERAEARRVLSTGRVVFLVIAAAAPLAAMVGNVPLGLLRGNGDGLPAAFLIATIVLLCFAVGYSAMSGKVVNTGAFYTYIARGLGKPAGLGAAYVAVIAYTALTAGLVAAFGYFTSIVLAQVGIETPWQIWAIVALVVTALLGYRSVDLSAKILGALMIAEFLILAVLNVAIVDGEGIEAFPARSFSSDNVWVASLGIGLMFAFTSFVGFESSALYGEETRDPVRSVPRATYISVMSIGAFYITTTWLLVGADATEQAKALPSADLGNLVFDIALEYGGDTLQSVMAVFLCTSVLASLLAVHNAASRYCFALGREGVLPGALGAYHPRHFSPHRGSLAVSAACTVLFVGFAVTGADPYTVYASTLVGLGTLGIVALQAAAALAVIAYFWRRPDRSTWRCVIAPGIGFLGLTTGFVLAALHYDVLTGSTRLLINALPLIYVLAAIAGPLVARWLEANRPVTYHRLAESQVRTASMSGRPRGIAYTRRYCLVGAGPAGLVMARALVREGVPFDWYDKSDEIGGIWSMSRPDTPMYESAHFISSRYTSGFVGYPMPADLPDYPHWKQIRHYLRDFADAFGLTHLVTLGVEVVEATPLPVDRWAVILSTGERREYDGVIVAPGVTWHPSRPTVSGEETFTGRVLHSRDYRSAAEFVDKRVLVVGAGNSGVDIACDAARTAEHAYLSVRRGYRFVPKHIFGLPTDAVINGVIDPPRGVTLAQDPNVIVDLLVGDVTRFGLPAPDHDLLQSHPIMNTQVIHHLAHGDLTAVGNVSQLTPTGALLVDGSHVDVDVVVLATGYEYRIPFIEDSLFDWDRGRPDLYLRMFHRQLDGLYVLGFLEFADAAYKRFDEMANLIVMDIHLRETGVQHGEWQVEKRTDDPDLRGGHTYLDTARHVAYVDSHTYQRVLAEVALRYDWPAVDRTSYEQMLRSPVDQRA